ncbi:hypothetical protein HanRHA438_Chr16g0754351 [Helianthus annuus]|nr:hypothetical protein HanIR_Chr16g0807151 [Helianthus annuus]KAJ0820770.1 hypothetical protein HanPSC8_Chr16g0711941 [Helianthus annuus]KAJ0835363.1 hypothetical protein HanRHA438_Chr16g0754351 [Helianthus annuus]
MELIIKINAGLGMEFGMYNSFLNIWILLHIVSLKKHLCVFFTSHTTPSLTYFFLLVSVHKQSLKNLDTIRLDCCLKISAFILSIRSLRGCELCGSVFLIRNYWVNTMPIVLPCLLGFTCGFMLYHRKTTRDLGKLMDQMLETIMIWGFMLIHLPLTSTTMIFKMIS